MGNAFTIYLLLSIALFILFVAWINYVNSSTAKSRKQITEVQVKRALGCPKYQIIYEQVFEAAIFNSIAIFLSMGFIKLILPHFDHLYGIELHPLTFGNWIAIIGFSFLISAVSGLFPAFFWLGERRVIESREKSQYLRNGLVVFQFVVSIVFIVATMVVMKQLRYIEQEKNEMAIENIIYIKSMANSNELQKEQKLFIDETLEMPGIQQVSVSSSVPGGDYTNVAGAIRPYGQKAEEGIKCYFIDVNEKYFDLYQIESVDGSSFENKGQNYEGFIVINTMAAQMLGYKQPSDAINQKLIFGEIDDQIKTIIGVVEDYHQKSLLEAIQPTVYSYMKYGEYISVKYSPAIKHSIVNRLGKTWKKIVVDQPFDYNFNDRFYSDQYKNDKVFGRLVSTFALLIIFIACLGLYSLIRLAINKRIKEIGVRKVNGAKVSELILMLNFTFIKWIAIAIAIAFPIARIVMDRWLCHFAYRTSISWWIFVFAGFLVVLIAFTTVYQQTWKAANRNPVEALRYE